MPLVRHLALQPLSRQHHQLLMVVLMVSKGLQQSISSAVLTGYFLEQLQPFYSRHFQVEQAVLRIIWPTSASIIQQHEAHITQWEGLLSSSFQPTQTVLAQLMMEIKSAIRWEERIVFEAVQSNATQSQLGQIAQLTAPLEAFVCHISTPAFLKKN